MNQGPPPPLRWFGKSWGAPCCQPQHHAATPTHASCSSCSRPFAANAQGVELLGYCADLQGWTIECFHLECFLEALGIAPSPPAPESQTMPRHPSPNRTTAERLLPLLMTGSSTAPERVALLCAALDQAELAGRNRHTKEHEIATGLVTLWSLIPEGGALLFSPKPGGVMSATLTSAHAGAVLSTAANADPELALTELLGRECARLGLVPDTDGPTPLVCTEPAAVCDCSQHENERAARQSRCDHKFIDSKTCLKCGWDPKA